MDNKSAGAMKRSDPFAATDALLGGGIPGESLFVINLCAANMPQAIDAPSVRAWGISGLDVYKLYQVSRLEEGRTRYRVRLGFFTSEADAELVLKSVRGKFATAFTSGLGDEDLKHASGYLKRPLQEIQEIQDVQRTGRYRIPKFAAEDLPAGMGETSRQPVLKAAPAKATPTIARAASALLAAESPTDQVQKKVKADDELVEFEWIPDKKAPTHEKAAAKLNAAAAKPNTPVSKPPVAKAAPQPAKTPAKPLPKAADLKLMPPQPASAPSLSKAAGTHPAPAFHVAAGRTIPDHGLSLAAESAARTQAQATQAQTLIPTQASKPASSAPSNPVQSPSPLPRPLVSASALSKLRAAAAQPRNASSEIPTLDTTQTIRTLTKTEIEDATAPKWFVVQLAISDHPANLDTMPRLDIFEAYRLYSVAVMEKNVIRHALRLGFFSEKVSAEAVMGYVKTFFGEPVIERISDAEQKRFGESFALSEPVSLESAKTQAQVITLEEKKRPIHPLKTSMPAAEAQNGVHNKSASKSAAAPVKRSAPLAAKKTTAHRTAHGKVSSKDLDEARLLGLSETAIRRVERNPSLLSRLVDKLTK